MQLAEQGIIDIPQEYMHEPQIQNKDGFTVAMIYAKQGIIPPQQWIHNKYLRCKVFNSQNNLYNFYTVQNLLQKNNISTPDEWKYVPLNEEEDNEIMISIQKGIIPQILYDANYQNIYGYTAAMLLATHKIIPPKLLQHDPLLKNKYGDTVAAILARHGIIPPKQWEHKSSILFKQSIRKNSDLYDMYITIGDLLLKNKAPLPNAWHNQKIKNYQQNQQQIEDAIYGKIPEEIYNPSEQNIQGYTVAMILSYNNIKIPQYWQHDPNIENCYGQKVIDIQILKNQIPQFEWYPSPTYQNMDGNTQALILARNNVKINNNYHHDPAIRNAKGFTVALFQAARGNIPDAQWEHNKFIRARYIDKNKIIHYFTVKNFLEANNIIVSQYWFYDNFVDKQENTQAMIKAQEGVIPNIQFQHDPLQSNMNDDTVALILIKQGILVPKNWIYNLDIQNAKHESIRSIAYQKGYSYSEIFVNREQYDQKYWIKYKNQQK